MSDIGQMNQAGMRAEAFQASLEATQQTDAKNDAALASNATEASAEKLAFEASENNPVGMMMKSSKLEKPEKVKTEKAEKAQESVLLRKEEADELADGFSQRQGNREYRLEPAKLSSLAQLLGSEIKEDSEEADILTTIRNQLSVKGKAPDSAFVDKSLEFLIEVTRVQLNKTDVGQVKERIQKILANLEKTKANFTTANQADLLLSGALMPGIAAMTSQSNQDHGETLAHYRNSVNNPQTLQDVRKRFKEIGYKAAFNEVNGFLSFAGGNTKQIALNSSEDVAIMGRLTGEIRKAQGILGVYRECKKQVTVMDRLLTSKGLISTF